MELTLWTYEGPPHVGAMRIASSMEGVHYVLHAPQGDTYADLLFTMIERRNRRPPVTYTTFQARDLGGDTAELVKRTIKAAVDRFQPEALLVGESCTAELIQDQPGSLAHGMDLGGVPVVSLELPAYSKKRKLGCRRKLLPIGAGPAQRSNAGAGIRQTLAATLAPRGAATEGQPAGTQPVGFPMPRRRTGNQQVAGQPWH